MKKILVAGLVLGAITMAVSPAAAQPAWSWTGFYGGGNVGYGWGYDPSTFTETETVTRREITIRPRWPERLQPTRWS